jgi:hypothetical protein
MVTSVSLPGCAVKVVEHADEAGADGESVQGLGAKAPQGPGEQLHETLPDGSGNPKNAGIGAEEETLAMHDADLWSGSFDAEQLTAVVVGIGSPLRTPNWIPNLNGWCVESPG